MHIHMAAAAAAEHGLADDDQYSGSNQMLLWGAAAALVLVAGAHLLWSRTRPKLPPLPPGPRNWPVIGALFSVAGPAASGLLPHQVFGRLAERYGPIVHLRMGTTPFLIVSDAHYARQVLKEQDAEFASRPYTALGNEYGFAGTVFTPYGPEWRHRRRITNLHLFSHEVFQSFQGVRDEEVVEALREVHAAYRAGKEVSIHDLVHTVTTNIICRMSLSKRYFGKNADAASEQMQLFKTATAQGTALFSEVCVGDIIPALRPLDIGGFQKAYRAVHQVQNRWMDAVLADRAGEDRAVPDFLDVLLGLKEKGELSDASVRMIMFETQTAGSETAATSVHWAFSELLRNPEAMQTAQAELDAVVGRARRVQESDVAHLPFLRAVVKETWRLHPPTPLGIPHHNEKETTLGGFRVPAKSTVFINSYAIGRDPKSWPDRPNEFVPERFLEATLTGTARHSHANIDGLGQDASFQLLPFSAGRRKCPGLQLGQATVHLTLAALLQAFDWSLPHGVRPADVDMQESSGIVLNRAAPCIALPTACRLNRSACDFLSSD